MLSKDGVLGLDESRQEEWEERDLSLWGVMHLDTPGRGGTLARRARAGHLFGPVPL